MQETIQYLQDNVNDWLRHAEAKHAVLIGVAAAGVTVVTTNISLFATPVTLLSAASIWVTALLSAAVALSLFSFLPQLSRPRRPAASVGTVTTNPLFFGHLASMTPEYIASLYSGAEGPDDMLLWRADQIITNSRIAVRKYQLFTAAVWCCLFAAFPPVALVAAVTRRIVMLRRHS